MQHGLIANIPNDLPYIKFVRYDRSTINNDCLRKICFVKTIISDLTDIKANENNKKLHNRTYGEVLWTLENCLLRKMKK